MIGSITKSLRQTVTARRHAAADAMPVLARYRRPHSALVAGLFISAVAVALFYYGFMFGVSAPARMMPFTVPIVIMGGAIIWALPRGDYAPTSLIEPVFIAFFAALIIWPNYLAIGLPSLPWLTLLRIIGVPMVVLLLVCLSVSERFRSEMRDIIASDKVMVRFLIALVILQTITIPISSDPGVTVNKYIIAQVNQTAIFFVACYAFTRPGLLQTWVLMLMVMLVIICAIGFWEWRLQAVPWAGHIPSYLKIEDETVQRILSPKSRAASGIYRVQSTATTPLGLAELIGLSIPFAMHLLLDRYKLLIRVGAALYIPFAVTVIFYTDSRLGVVTALCSAVFYLLIWALLRWRQDRKSLFGPAIVLAYPAIFAGFIAATFLVGRLRAEVWGNGPQQASTESRIEQWRMAIPKIFENPVGYGLGQGANELGFRNLAGVLTIDSYFLSILLEIGVVGFVVYYGLILRGVFASARTVVTAKGDEELRLLLPITVALMDFIVSKIVFSQEANHPLIFMMLGAVVAMGYRARNLERYGT